MLLDSLVLSHLQYALPVWGPSLPQTSVNRIQKLQNWGVRMTRSLHKYDHVSHHMKSLSWLPIVHLIQYRSNCAMYHHYTNNVIPLFPPVAFGCQHECDTHCPVHFANLPRCRLSSTQHFFRTRGAKWWNLFPSDVVSLGYSTFSSVVYDSLI